MTISFVSVSAADIYGSDDVTITAPSGIQNGDLLLAFYGCFKELETAVPVALSGFTSIAQKFSSSGNDATIAALYKIASSEAGNYAITGSTTSGTGSSVGGMMVLRGVDQSNPIDVTYVEGSHFVREQNTITPTPQPITTITDNAWIVIFAQHTFGNNVTGSVPPSGYTERLENSDNDGRTFNLSTKLKTSAGTDTPGVVTFTNGVATDDSSIFTLAIRPAAVSSSYGGINRGIMRGTMRGVG